MRINQSQIDTGAAVTIRRLRDDDADRRALAALAERDSARVPNGAVLVAEVEGRMLAAISIGDGHVIADPFSRTRELRTLLKLRRAQLIRRARPRRFPALRLRGRPRAALAASPPGAGGRLLSLDSR